MDELKLFAAIGEEGFTRLVAAFYRRIPGDDILGPMYPAADLQGAEQRLRDFLIYRFGGPDRYIAERGHPRLRARHFPFAVTPAARDRWMLLMTEALANADIPVEARQTLWTFFEAMSTFLINQPGQAAQS
jgi:hemoglobin